MCTNIPYESDFLSYDSLKQQQYDIASKLKTFDQSNLASSKKQQKDMQHQIAARQQYGLLKN